ncbi:DUF1761 domain-containing protein [uncultured Cellulomonas sp.]|uniref:DUF1761 domain-containing protein n=1 Tax=uncultured Cellulomonas sp. TaxID=189682 RepID=UPI0028EB60F5|nr:DUF1761 domain-containing protein [uncultured Cellulomonas sp.]
MTTTFDLFGDLRWFAVPVATLAYFLLGAVWFTPLFGKAWDDAIGHRRVAGDRFSAAYYVVPLLSSLLVTVTMAALLARSGTEGLVDALALAVVVGLGVALAISVTNALTPHTPHPFRLGLITGGYHLIGIVVVTLLLALMTST